MLGIWPLKDVDNNDYPAGTIEADRAGQWLAQGLRAVIWTLKQDIDHLTKSYGLAHYSSNNPCPFCPCDRHETRLAMRFNNFRSDARWKRCLHDAKNWRDRYTSVHWLFELPGLSILNVEADELHCVHLGTTSYILGSCLFLLCFKILPGTRKENLRRVWTAITEEYLASKIETQYSNLTLGSFCDVDAPERSYPRLKGKGCEIKDLVLPLRTAWQRFMRVDHREDALVLELLDAQISFQTIMTTHAHLDLLPRRAAQELVGATDIVLNRYSLLANAADRAGALQWPTTPKFHYLWHLAQAACYLNPRRSNCAVDETFVGIMKSIVQSCANGTKAEAVPEAVAEKYGIAMHFLEKYT